MTSQTMIKLGEIQFINDSPERGLYKSFYENSSDDELFSEPPYPLAMDIDELTSPPTNTRPAKKYKKHPDKSNPPRPQNDWVLFLRNFTALLNLNGTKMNSTTKVARMAADEWRRQPPKVRRYFKFLGDRAKEKHNELYPEFNHIDMTPETSSDNHFDMAPETSPESHIDMTPETSPESHIDMSPESSSVDNFSEDFNSMEILKPLNDFTLYNESPNNDEYAINNQEISDQTDDQEIDNLFNEIIDINMLYA
ncbi:21064_t:CDS:2 [Dentiscutata erythropus]|uniref:21064_t:CDS:1 n=1 Tax=Dentiscutata erythropus TaxID=1348616 RepID=A0A9N9AXT2_9GLOM|nr:21064_t:CDS:2 [Dentiscutata erythropus]